MTNAGAHEKSGIYGRKIKYIKVMADSVANCWRAHPPMFAGLAFVSAALCAVQAGEIFAMRSLFDAVAEYIGGTMPLNGMVTAAAPMAVLLVLFPVINVFAYLGQGYFWRRGSGYLMARYHESVRRIPLIDFEKTETFDQMKKAQLGSESSPSAGRSAVQFVFYFIPYVIFTSAFLAGVKPALLAALPIIFASVLFAQFIRAGIIRRFTEQNAGLRRQTEYLENCVTGKEYYKETRTLGATGYFFRLFIDSAKRFNKASAKAERKAAFAELLLRFVNILGYAGILAALVYYVTDGSISVGAFASVFYSIDRISALLHGLTDYFGEMLNDIATASFTYEFMNIPEEGGSDAELDKKSDIRLEGVSFAYPGAEGSALNDISLTIKRGETLAIVGENGAGKTTLIKIIAGLYKPASGTVRYGDKDICDYKAKTRYNRISGVFQDYARYKLTARENIEISDAGVAGRGDIRNAERIAAEAGVSYADLPGGLDATLSREFGGIELSGGQWQRVAIARGLYRSSDIIILDEPTAAIDPIEESNIFRLFKESARGKTAILVTHRLGSVKIADRILLMEEGGICELGPHGQLMAANGKYAGMYREQAGWYDR